MAPNNTSIIVISITLNNVIGFSPLPLYTFPFVLASTVIAIVKKIIAERIPQEIHTCANIKPPFPFPKTKNHLRLAINLYAY